MARKIIDEILDIKSRFDIADDKDIRLIKRISPLMRSFYLIQSHINKDDMEAKTELYKYFPVALVVTIEGFFRETIGELIDNHAFYREKLHQFKDFKFNIEPILAIEASKISIGDLVSHLLPLNNLTDINKTMKTFTNRNFIKDIKALINIAYEKKTASKKDNANLVFKNLNKMFRLRNIICHELSNTAHINEIEVEQMFMSVTWLHIATDVYVNHVRQGKTKAYDLYYEK